MMFLDQDTGLHLFLGVAVAAVFVLVAVPSMLAAMALWDCACRWRSERATPALPLDASGVTPSGAVGYIRATDDDNDTVKVELG